MAMAFNTRDYSWADTEIRMLDSPVVGARAFSYGVTHQKNNIYGRGNKPIRRTRGNKGYEGSVTVLQSELEALQDLAKQQGLEDITDLKPFPVVVSYENSEGIIVTDVAEHCEFTALTKGMAQNDEVMEVELPLIIGNIRFNV